MRKYVTVILLILYMISLSCTSVGTGSGEGFGANEGGISARGAIGRVELPSGPLFEEGDGRDIHLAIILPEAQGDVPDYLPLHIQGLLNNNFHRFSDIKLIDRQNLNQIIAEQNIAISGSYSDIDFVRIGNLTNAQYFLFGTISRLPQNRFSLQLSITDSSTGVSRAHFIGDGSLAQIVISGALINEASADLLTQMGVRLTAAGRQSLEAGLARGITAQAAGSEYDTVVGGILENFVRINGGTFTMGSPVSEFERGNREGPQRQVTVSSFNMGKYQVTQREYQYIMGANPSRFTGDNLPVERVRWFDAIEYCNRLSERIGLTPAYTVSGTGNNRVVTWNRDANGIRLPTEAEWEYACRAGTTTPFNTGNNITTEQANYNGRRTMPVGSFAANPWGLYDMPGNVYEWCWDWFGRYPGEAQIDPAGPSSGDRRVARGGSWTRGVWQGRSAYRRDFGPPERFGELGFRVVRPE